MTEAASRPTIDASALVGALPKFRPDIQGLRAIAVLMVVAYHSGLPVPGGFTGVDVFFAISGFVITGMLERRLATGSGIGFRQFYARRFRRLYPALAIMVAVVAALSFLVQSPLTSAANPSGAQQLTANTGLGAIFIVANFVIYRTPGGGYFQDDSTWNPLLHTWSLSVEEQFYLVFPALLAFAWYIGCRTRTGKKVTALLLSAAGLISLAACIALTFGMLRVGAHSDPASLSFYASPTRAWEFAAGSVAALAIPRFLEIGRRKATLVALVGTCLLLVSAFGIDDRMPFPGYIALLPVLGATALLLAGSRPYGNRISATLSRGPFVRIGDVSYSWYLWHWPAVVFTGLVFPSMPWLLPIAAGGSLVPAWISFRRVENPIRRSTRIRGARLLAVALTCVLVPSIACGVLHEGAKAGWWRASVVSMARQIEPTHAGLCDDAGDPAGLPGGACVLNPSAGGAPIVLIGDSNAEQFTGAVVRAGTDLGRPVVVATLGGCPFAVVDVFEQGEARDDCRLFVEGALEWLRGRPTASVFVASAGDLYVVGDWAQLRSPGTNEIAAEEEPKARIYGAGLAESLTGLRSTGADVTLVETIPHFPGWWPDRCANIVLLVSVASCGTSAPLAQVNAEQLAVSQAESSAVLISGVAGLNLDDRICPGGECATNTNDLWRYRDGLHITVGESERLGPVFRDYLTVQERGGKHA